MPAIIIKYKQMNCGNIVKLKKDFILFDSVVPRETLFKLFSKVTSLRPFFENHPKRRSILMTQALPTRHQWKFLFKTFYLHKKSSLLKGLHFLKDSVSEWSH